LGAIQIDVFIHSFIQKVLANNAVQFQIKIPNGFWENSEKL